MTLDAVYAILIIGGLIFAFYRFGTEDKRREKREQESANKAAGFLSLLHWFKK